MSIQLPPQCVDLKTSFDSLTGELGNLQQQLQNAAGDQKIQIIQEITDTRHQMNQVQQDLNACLLQNTGPIESIPADATQPSLSGDTTLVEKKKVISLDFLQKKFDEFFNKRTDKPLFSLRLHHHDYFNGHNVDNDPPASDATFSFLHAISGYNKIPSAYIDMKQLPHGYYFNDINSSIIKVNIDSSQPAPLSIVINFETGGDTEMPSTGVGYPDMNFTEFYISLKFSLAFDPVHKTIDLFTWVNDIEKMKNTPISGAALVDALIQQFIVVHIKTENGYDPGGYSQQAFRQQIYDKIVSNKDQINAQVNRWFVGKNGDYAITGFSNDGHAITITYNVPKNQLDPFCDVQAPADWPSVNNPASNPAYDFSPGTLANIDHIVVLTMENRSFDHMLGYLSLPVEKGGMGRTDVDGLKGDEQNSYNGVTYKSFPLAAGNTVFYPDPQHDTKPVLRQINGGKMNGFVKSYAEDAGDGTGDGSTIMGYHTGTNLPVYDALVRDFSFCHRWFAAHPGPTFCNRFYELTGRLNITSKLNKDITEGFWEYNNSNPLTPVFTKTIFDYLDEYQHIPKISWNYFEYGYCFLRFFEKYTFDYVNVVTADDAEYGFYANARRGSLPSVCFVDPHFIEYPPHGNCDGPPADVADGQILIQNVVEAVIAGPKWNKTLLIILYDEHGGFYDHVPPPPATKFSTESPIDTYGVRIPAFLISPWVSQGKVFGHDASEGTESLYFDSSSVLKTIAKRFMSDYPPYIGPRYRDAKDLSPILNTTPRKTSLLPFIRYDIIYNASGKSMDVQWAVAKPGIAVWQYDANKTKAQHFSFEEAGDGLYYIRTHCGNYYLSVNVPRKIVVPPGPRPVIYSRVDNVVIDPQPEPVIIATEISSYSIVQNPKYIPGGRINIFVDDNPAYQKWSLSNLGITVFDMNIFTISCPAFPGLVLKAETNDSGARILLASPDNTISSPTHANTWKITTPLINSGPVVGAQ